MKFSVVYSNVLDEGSWQRIRSGTITEVQTVAQGSSKRLSHEEPRVQFICGESPRLQCVSMTDTHSLDHLLTFFSRLCLTAAPGVYLQLEYLEPTACARQISKLALEVSHLDTLVEDSLLRGTASANHASYSFIPFKPLLDIILLVILTLG